MTSLPLAGITVTLRRLLTAVGGWRPLRGAASCGAGSWASAGQRVTACRRAWRAGRPAASRRRARLAAGGGPGCRRAGRPRRGRLRPAGGSCVRPTVITSGPTRPGSRPEPTNRQALAAADRGRRVPSTHPPNHHAHTHPTRNPRAVPAWKAHVRCVKFTLCKCTHIPTAPFAAIRCCPLTRRIRWRK